MCLARRLPCFNIPTTVTSEEAHDYITAVLKGEVKLVHEGEGAAHSRHLEEGPLLVKPSAKTWVDELGPELFPQRKVLCPMTR